MPRLHGARTRFVTMLLLVFAAASCADLPSESPHPSIEDAVITVVAGSGQTGTTGSVLPVSLRVRVLDERGTPLAGVLVEWVAEEPDAVYPATSMTDEDGEARTYWTPRLAGDDRLVRARVGGKEVAFHAVVDDAPPTGFGELTLAELETFEGSGQAVHPDVAFAPWMLDAGARFLAATPYPFGDATKENPSIYINVGLDHEWRVPDGATNPVATPDAGHLSDTDLVADPLQRELRLYYRRAGDGNTLLVTSSADGRMWSQPRALFRTRNHEMVSPTVVRRSANQWEMWSVNSGSHGCSAIATQVERRVSTDGYTWSAPMPVQMSTANEPVWHLDVQYVAPLSKYVAVYSVKPRTDCATAAMFVATSTDGITWVQQDQPLLVRGVIPEFRHIVYRSTFLYDAEQQYFTFWHSGAAFADGKWTWRIASERRQAHNVLNGTGATAAERWMEPSQAPPLRIPP